MGAGCRTLEPPGLVERGSDACEVDIDGGWTEVVGVGGVVRRSYGGMETSLL